MYVWTKEQQEAARKDFRVFLYIVWTELGLPDPTPIQQDIARTLQNPPSDRFILEGFRGVAKSFITCAFAAWTLFNDPQKKVLVVSASKPRADDNAIFIKKIMNIVHFLNYLLPKKNQRDTQNIFDVAPAAPDISPSVKSIGITGQITGTRADLLISDDVEVPNNSNTQVQREKLGEAVKEYESIIKPNGTIVYLGTPQNEMSLYNELQEKRGYKCVIYPVAYPENATMRNYYGDRLGKAIRDTYDSDPLKYAGKPTDPKRFGEYEIAQRKISTGKATFALQFLLYTDLSDAERYPLKLSDLMIEPLDIFESSTRWSWASGQQQLLPHLESVGLGRDYYYRPLARSEETAPYLLTTMFIDPSGRGSDQTAYAIASYLNGYIFLLDADGYTGGYSEETLKKLATKAKVFGCQTCIVEPNFGNGMFAELLKPVMLSIAPQCAIMDGKPARTQKEARIIDTLEPVMMSHKLIINQAVIESDLQQCRQDQQYSLFYQMTRLTRERGALAHDDKIDALEGVVAYYRELMQAEQVADSDSYVEEWFEELDSYGIIKPKPTTPMPTKSPQRKQYKTYAGEYQNVTNNYLFKKI